MQRKSGINESLFFDLCNKARKYNFLNSKNDNKLYILLTEAKGNYSYFPPNAWW